MSRNFIFTPEAESDALDIWERIADDDSEVAADRVIAGIYDECQKLGEMPGMSLPTYLVNPFDVLLVVDEP